MYRIPPKKQTGFTLIEMMMVLLIIGATMKIVAVSFEDIGFSARYEQTISRLDTIRQAIIGNPKRTINGQPDISGFVSDMGRLPRNIRELVDQNYCVADMGVDETEYDSVTYASAKQHCDTAYGPNSWKETRDYSACSNSQDVDKSDCITNSGIWYPFESGWNGPYISLKDNLLVADAFTDGWGRELQGNTDFNYGWSACRWNGSHDTADSINPNQMPDDTDGTPDGLPNCITTYTTLNQHFTIYSLGKNGSGDVAEDGSVTCGANEYDGDCYTSILDEEYKIDISNGISVSIKADYQPGVCHYLKTQAIVETEKNRCLTFGGVFGSCKTTDTQVSCGTNNLYWDTQLGWCVDFNQQTSAECTVASNKWGICVDEAKNLASCTGTDDVWWEAKNWCIDKSLDAGVCGLLTHKTDFCYSNDGSCQAGGGDWENCVFSADKSLTTSPPTVATESCKLTVKSCEKSALGTWNYADGNCTIDDQQPCLSAGGTWTTSCSINSDGVTSEGGCKSIGGSWQGTFPQTSATCTGTGKTWHSDSNYCEFSSAKCDNPDGDVNTADEGEYRAVGVCRRSHSDITASTLTQAICESYGGQEWVTEKKQICMNVFYRNPSDSGFSRIASNPVAINLDGSFQNIQFTLPNAVTQAECEDMDGFNDGEWDLGLSQCRFNVTKGINAIGVYEYDGDCDPFDPNNESTTNSYYPSNRNEEKQVIFLPNTSIPTINW